MHLLYIDEKLKLKADLETSQRENKQIVELNNEVVNLKDKLNEALEGIAEIQRIRREELAKKKIGHDSFTRVDNPS
jgi:hypothetical protein